MRRGRARSNQWNAVQTGLRLLFECLEADTAAEQANRALVCRVLTCGQEASSASQFFFIFIVKLIIIFHRQYEHPVK